MLRRVNIGNKLALLLVGLSLFLIALLSSLFYTQFDTALKERVLLQLSSVKQLKIVKIKTEINDRIAAFKKLMNEEDIESDYFTSVRTLPLEIDSAFGVYLDMAVMDVTLTDLTTEEPTNEITLGFIGKKESEYLIAIAHVPEIQEILLERTGLGQTGESYIVGSDYRLRSQSRFKVNDPEEIEVRTPGVTRALSGQAGEDTSLDYRGVEVFSSYEEIFINGLRWVILTEIDRQEALFPLKKLKNNLLYIFIFILIFVLLVSYFLSRMIVRPIVTMEKSLKDMSKGILNEVPVDEKRQDEIGRMFIALQKLVRALKETVVFADKIGSGNFKADYKPLSEEDKMGTALIQMKEKLRAFKENEERLLKENQRSILNGEEKERSRLSKELHDGLGPILTTLRMKLQAAELNESTKKGLLHRIDETIGEVRRMSNNLMPNVLVDFGAGEAIGNLLKQIEENFPIEVRYKNDMPAESEIDDNIHITLYRIAQESINNAIKHAKATELKASMSEFEDHVGFFIADNGIGFDPEKSFEGNGIRNMKERVKLANGTIDIRTGNKGTIIEVEIPLQ
ncbi:ATP-binding protein [Ekhidna sp.]|uniref:sensor histidine kinase n=1 Tax=Ekhidna sp. TaxID=2608089 RepID=UPI003CCBE152